MTPKDKAKAKARKPRKPKPVVYCARNHNLGRVGKKSHCWRCDFDDRRQAELEEAEAMTRPAGPTPAYLQIRIVDTGQVLTFKCPPPRKDRRRLKRRHIAPIRKPS